MSNRAVAIVAVVLMLVSAPLYITARSYIIDHPKPVVETIAAYPRPEFARVMSLGFNAMLADFLFIKAAYYFGTHYVTDRTYALLGRMIEVIARLNPDLKIAILFGDAAISSMRTPDAIAEANRLLDIGHELYPDDWNFVFRKGMNYYLYLDDMEKAYPFLYKGARMPGAPEKAYWLVTKAMTKGGGYHLAYDYTKDQWEQAKDKHMRDMLETRLRFYTELIILSDAAQRFLEKEGRSPDRDLKDLVKRGYVAKIPQEPYGGAYYYDETKRLVVTSSDNILKRADPDGKKEKEKKKETPKP